jgi:hypothetical protein
MTFNEYLLVMYGAPIVFLFMALVQEDLPYEWITFPLIMTMLPAVPTIMSGDSNSLLANMTSTWLITSGAFGVIHDIRVRRQIHAT